MVSIDESRWIPLRKIEPLLRELILRCGTIERTAEYSGITAMTIHRMLKKYNGQKQIQKRTARLLILALYEKRKEDRRNGQSEAFRRSRVAQARLEERMMDLIGY